MMVTKKIFFSIALLLGVNAVTFGQNFRSNTTSTASKSFEKIESQKIAFITQNLNITSKEGQQFFPIYNQYCKEMRAIKAAKSNNSKTGRDVIEFDSKEVELKRLYRTKFSDIIGVSRASQFFVVEQEFKEMLYEEWRSRRD